MVKKTKKSILAAAVAAHLECSSTNANKLRATSPADLKCGSDTYFQAWEKNGQKKVSWSPRFYQLTVGFLRGGALVARWAWMNRLIFRCA